MKPLLNEQLYQNKWQQEQTYNYNPNSKNKTFVIDTPPPTVSGSLHIGHIFSYTQTDILARYHRMTGKNIFYPMGWDNNGLPTEKRIQTLYKIFCDPSMCATQEPTYPEIKNRKNQKKNYPILQPLTQKTFLKLCREQSQEDQIQYKQLWCNMGLSVDWNQSYETISSTSQIVSQRSFIDLYQKGLIENRYTPVFWDTQFKTAVAQADIEDKKTQGFFYDIKFKIHKAVGEFTISTTRPELLPACIAIAAHPEDKRYKKYFNKQAVSPLFSGVVPIIPSLHANPKKGTGILMICSFGDREDIQFWQKHKLPLKQIIGRDGFFKDIVFINSHKQATDTHNTFLSLQPEQAQTYYAQLKGLRVLQARQKIIQILTQTKHIVTPEKPTEQLVKFYEKGDFPLELIPTRQWYIKILKYKKELLQQGQQVKWHPVSMLKRYQQWVEGLNQDWCISRQRFVGVPFPIWYPLDKNKIPNYNKPLIPITAFFNKDKTFKHLENAVNPAFSAPAQWDPQWSHYTEAQRGKADGFIADTAVMDTWATSSLTPQINSHWGKDIKRYNKIFPADLRPQAHEIIRTWAFYTIVKSFFHSKFFEHKTSELLCKSIPWTNIAISGWVTNPQKLKVSKSKGGSNISPQTLIKEYSADALRYWAGKARLGSDTIYDEHMFKTGRKLIVKLNNAFKFIQIFTPYQTSITFTGVTKSIEGKEGVNTFTGVTKSMSYIQSTVDTSWIFYLIQTHQKITHFLENFEYSLAFDMIEKSFWIFCDNYLELVKGRAYKITHTTSFDEKQNLINSKDILSAIYSLDLSMYMFVKWMAPYLPYITEHIWSQRYATNITLGEKSSSVHTALWSEFNVDLLDSKPEENILEFSFNLLKQIRNIKSAQNKSLSTPVKQLIITATKTDKIMFNKCKEDIARATFVKPTDIIFQEDTKIEELKVELILE